MSTAVVAVDVMGRVTDPGLARNVRSCTPALVHASLATAHSSEENPGLFHGER